MIAQTETPNEEAVESKESTEAAQEDESSDLDSEDQATDEAGDNETESDGQPDLDEAFELKLTASSTRDLDRIGDLCESAIEKGLNPESEAQAKALWSSVLFNHAKQLNRRIAPNNKLSTRWRWLRSQAISRLNKAIELQPGKISALILLARLHSLNSGDRDAALESIEKAIAQIKDDNEKLSEALYIRARLAEDEKTRIADLSQAVKIDPNNFDALMERAVYFLGKDKNEDALADFKKMLEIEKENIDRYIFVSQALRQKRMFKESASILDLAIEVEDENDELYVLRGQAHLAAENDEDALNDLNQALEINRQNIDALNLRSRVYLVKEDYEKALKDANELIQQQPESTAGLELRSLIYRSQNNLAKAIEDVEKLQEKQPNDLDLMFDLAILYNADNRPSKALPIYDEILSNLPDPAQSQIRRNRGDAYLSLGQHENAIDDYETAIDIIEQFSGSDRDGMSDEREKDMKAGLLNNLAWVLATSTIDDLRDGQRAIELATEAAEITDYKAAYILSTLASGYAETGDFETAKKWAAKAVEFAESDEQRIGLQEELDMYKLEKPWREMENVEAEAADKKDESSNLKSSEEEPSETASSETESPETPNQDSKPDDSGDSLD
ncbi:MAG: tetratricopeptide repeat protein [Planctomycetota bacterium]